MRRAGPYEAAVTNSSGVLELHNVYYDSVLFRDVRVSGSRLYSTILR